MDFVEWARKFLGIVTYGLRSQANELAKARVQQSSVVERNLSDRLDPPTAGKFLQGRQLGGLVDRGANGAAVSKSDSNRGGDCGAP